MATLGVAAPAAASAAPRAAKTPQNISMAIPEYPVAGEQTFRMWTEATSGMPVILTSGSTDVCTVDGDILTFVSAGDCVIRARQEGDATWAWTSEMETFPVYPPRPDE